MQQFFSLLTWRLFAAQHVSGFFPPIIRSSMTAVAASGFTFVSWWQSCCVRGQTFTFYFYGTVTRKVVVFPSLRPSLWNISAPTGCTFKFDFWVFVWNLARKFKFNPLNPELNPICYLLALLGAHHFLHVSRIRVKSLTLRLLMPYIYGAPILDVSRSHTTTQHSR